jgi:hypothetical protein
MNSDTILARNEVASSYENEFPYSSYTKTILGKVLVTVWDNVLDKPVEVLLEGNPRRKDENSIVKLWSPKEDSFFKRVNRKHFSTGRLIPYRTEDIPSEVKTIEQSTDEELAKIVSLRYMAFVAEINKINSIAVLFRMRGIAEEMDKSAKITAVIEKRISELQNSEYISPKKGEAVKEA